MSPRRSTGAAGTQLTAAQSVNRTTGTGENSVKRICPQVFVLKYWICILFFFYSYCYWMAYIMYIICALQGTQEKLPEEALRAAKESEGEDCSPHMWSEYLAVTQTTTTTTKPLQIIILRLLSELVKWSFVDAAKYLVAQFSPKTERKRTFHRSSNLVEANISQISDWHLVDMFSVPIG